MILLQTVADAIRLNRPLRALRTLMQKPLITFRRERENRPPRYIAVVNAYKAGDPINEIAERFGCASTTVHRYARMAGLYRPKESTVRDGILAMYQLGKPISEIAAKFGVSVALVSKYANEAGIGRNPHRKRT